jgi:hypothetical protein
MVLALAFQLNMSPVENDLVNYRIYYGRITDEILQQMKEFDVVIVEPLRLSENIVSQLHQNGTKIIGYVSVIEMPLWDERVASLITESDFLLDISYLENGNGIADIVNGEYLKVMDDVLIPPLESLHLDGIFIDTLGSLTYYYDKEIQTEAVLVYSNWLEDLKRDHPDWIVIQNRGFDVLNELPLDLVDMFLWEDYNRETTFSIWKDRTRLINTRRYRDGMTILTLTYGENESFKEAISWFDYSNLHHRIGESHSVWDFNTTK